MKKALINRFFKIYFYKTAKIVYNFFDFPTSYLKVAKNYLFPGIIVLLYHRVFNTEIDAQLLCVSPENFEKQMSYLKNNYKILKVSELLNNIKNKKAPKRAVVITFDDGYSDNYEFALPILEKLKIPAIFFISSAGVDKDQESWSHQLEQIFLSNKNLPGKLDIEFNGKQYVFDTSENKATKNTYNELHKTIKLLNKTNRDKIIGRLFNWSGATKITRKYYRTLSANELQKMANSEYVGIGGHTLNHVCLAALPRDEQKKEIEENKRQLEEIINKEIIAFSYPYGNKVNYNKESVKIVKENYKIAFSNFPGIVRNSTNIYELPRFLVRNWDIEIFKKQINNFFLKS